MKFAVEKQISNFIESQFPQFYLEEGENFVMFIKAYYEWMEEQKNPISEARMLFDYRDIDNTVEKFLVYFQQKYLYGIPFNVIVNPRFLLKHILDIYRSKGTIQCYRLLFKLIYDEDIEIYLPGVDILKPSDGTWVQPKYLEVNDSSILDQYMGQRVVGLSSNTTATVEQYIKEPINQNIISTLYISNVLPQGGIFIPGEKLVLEGKTGNSEFVYTAPSILGSLDSVQILNGGQNFEIGDILKIAHRDIDTNEIISNGIDGFVRVTGLTRGQGQLNYFIAKPGFGVKVNANTFTYRGNGDTTGTGASFNIGSLSYAQTLEYNIDLIVDYKDQTLNAVSYGFPGDNSANNTFSTIGDALLFDDGVFGSISSLTNIRTGKDYTKTAETFIRSFQISNTLPGTISYSTSSNTVTISGGNFTTYFANNDLIYLKANSSLSTSIEYQVIKEVTNSSSIILYGPPKYSSTATAHYRIAPSILSSQFALYETVMSRIDGTVNGLNSVASANPSSGNNIIGQVTAVNSGKGYIDNENIKLYLSGGITNPVIVSGGSGYSNTDQVIFSGGGISISPAKATIQTNGSGVITSISVTYYGSGYESPPIILIKTKTGAGANITTSITEFDTNSEVTGLVVKGGIGRKTGYWSTTKSFLNANKYIQDSYFYQDYSYQIKTASTLDKYKNILYNTFHTAGSELFGQFLLINKEQSNLKILYEPTAASYEFSSLSIDTNQLKTDNTLIKADHG